MNGVPRPVHRTDERQRALAALGQVIARLVERQGGAWRVVECAGCLGPAGPTRYLELTLPAGPTFLVVLDGPEVLGGEAVPLPTPPSGARIEQLLAWVQGISLPAQEMEP